MNTISKKLEFRIFILNQFVNTPLLGKISSSKELPEDVNDWIVFDMEKNLEYARKLTTK